MQTDLKQRFNNALTISSELEKMPSGDKIIYLKKYLSKEDFSKSMEYIAEFTFNAFLSVLSPDLITRLQELDEENKEFEFKAAIATIIATNEQIAKATDNGLKFAIEVVAEAKQINLNQ
jgi:hypothetical protein